MPPWRSRQAASSANPRHTGADFLACLKLVARRYRGRPLHIIPDNSSTHSTTAVQGWLVRHPHVQFHFTPKGASWLNHGRGVVQHPDAQVRPSRLLRHGARFLVRHIQRYIDEWNSHPTPFIWARERPTSSRRPCGTLINMTSRTEHSWVAALPSSDSTDLCAKICPHHLSHCRLCENPFRLCSPLKLHPGFPLRQIR